MESNPGYLLKSFLLYFTEKSSIKCYSTPASISGSESNSSFRQNEEGELVARGFANIQIIPQLLTPNNLISCPSGITQCIRRGNMFLNRTTD